MTKNGLRGLGVVGGKGAGFGGNLTVGWWGAKHVSLRKLGVGGGGGGGPKWGRRGVSASGSR